MSSFQRSSARLALWTCDQGEEHACLNQVLVYVVSVLMSFDAVET